MRDSVPNARYSAFVMYCVYGESRSSLLIESTDSMIIRGFGNNFFPKRELLEQIILVKTNVSGTPIPLVPAVCMTVPSANTT